MYDRQRAHTIVPPNKGMTQGSQESKQLKLLFEGYTKKMTPMDQNFIDPKQFRNWIISSGYS